MPGADRSVAGAGLSRRAEQVRGRAKQLLVAVGEVGSVRCWTVSAMTPMYSRGSRLGCRCGGRADRDGEGAPSGWEDELVVEVARGGGRSGPPAPRVHTAAYVRLYAFMSQVTPEPEVALEELYVFCRALLHVLPADADGSLQLGDELVLTHLRIDETSSGSIDIEGGRVSPGTAFPGGGQGGHSASAVDRLSAVVDQINQRFGLDLDDRDQLVFDQFEKTWLADQELRQVARNNAFEAFLLEFTRGFKQTVLENEERNREVYELIYGNADWRNRSSTSTHGRSIPTCVQTADPKSAHTLKAYRQEIAVSAMRTTPAPTGFSPLGWSCARAHVGRRSGVVVSVLTGWTGAQGLPCRCGCNSAEYGQESPARRLGDLESAGVVMATTVRVNPRGSRSATRAAPRREMRIVGRFAMCAAPTR